MELGGGGGEVDTAWLCRTVLWERIFILLISVMFANMGKGRVTERDNSWLCICFHLASTNINIVGIKNSISIFGEKDIQIGTKTDTSWKLENGTRRLKGIKRGWTFNLVSFYIYTMKVFVQIYPHMCFSLIIISQIFNISIRSLKLCKIFQMHL